MNEQERNTILFALRFLQDNIELAAQSRLLDRRGEWVYCEESILTGEALDALCEDIKE
jgi:hypothetical protein